MTYIEPIELEHWSPNLEKPGYLKYDGQPTIRKVVDELNRRLFEALEGETLELFKGDRGFSAWNLTEDGRDQEMLWPRARWIACFAVEGGSEAEWVHIEAIAIQEGEMIRQTDRRQLLAVFKVWNGINGALTLAAAATRCFYGNH